MSEFLENCDFIDDNRFEHVKPIDSNGNTSLCYIVQITGKSFFLKQLRPELATNQAYRTLFRKEFELGYKIKHKNIVEYDSLQDNDNDCYILMENIVGETLNKFIISHPDYFNSRSNLDKFFNQLLSALKCLHENHVIYSDLKPDNIMITQINNDVKLIDLGFCFTDSYRNTEGTTREFSAPEHINKGKLDVTTDIYGIGKIIEYIGKNSTSNIPGIYAKIMLRCLKERQQDRIQNTDEIIKLINKRKHTVRRTLVAIVAIVILFIGFKSLTYSEHFISWWDGFQIISPHVEYDAEYRHSYYSILSEEDHTCEAVGHTSLPNVYLHINIPINDREYKLTHISDSAFFRKKYLKTAYIPDGVLSIGKDAFRECKNMLSVNLPESIIFIDDYAFYGCNTIKYLRLPSKITVISECAFSGCGLKKIDIPEGVTHMGLDAFGNCDKLEEVKLPSTLKMIDRGVFWNCSSLKQISIPQNVANIGEFCFFGCNSLTDIYNLASIPQIIPPIHRNPSQITLHVPAESIEAYRNADYWKDMNIVPIH